MVETIHPVMVVPMLAPIIRAMDSARVTNPAFTKLTTIKVLAEDDYTKAVTRKPVIIPIKGLLVMLASTLRMAVPVIFCRPSLICFMPKMKKPRVDLQL
jgi:hypothetical protein